jgi:hypothetical protein
MEEFVIEGGVPLKRRGDSLGKQECRPAPAFRLFVDGGAVLLHNIPQIRDVLAMRKLIESLGAVLEEVDSQHLADHHPRIDRLTPGPGPVPPHPGLDPHCRTCPCPRWGNQTPAPRRRCDRAPPSGYAHPCPARAWRERSTMTASSISNQRVARRGYAARRSQRHRHRKCRHGGGVGKRRDENPQRRFRAACAGIV